MPIKHAAIKALRQTEKRTVVNNAARAKLVALRRAFRKALTAKDSGKLKELLSSLQQALDKAAQKKVLTKNNAGRIKSRLAAAALKIK
ncbi:MAG: 30S ribosomal protein S20 [Candidatus Magasanikbacteria bacterium]|nr:30S ribosomal protein S20 [Candidatus Magasanikbacteria bacterium]